MANNFTKTMRQALQEAREYRDTTEGGPGSGPQKGGKKFSSSEIKKAYGILNDPRYKQGNYTGAAKAINKLAPGQISALQKAYAPLKGKTDYKSATGSKMNFNKLKNKMKSYSVSHLQQLSVADIPMVSDAAKELL